VARPGLNAVPAAWDPDPAAVLRDYLTRLAAGLPGSRRTRAAVLAEFADGLIEATDARVAGGMARGPAVRAAVAEFGDPDELARMLAAEQAGTTAHRVGLGLVLTGPLVGLVWLAAWATANGLGWLDEIPALVSRFPALVALLGLGIPAAVLATLTGAGPLVRRLAVAPRRAAGLAMLAAGAAVAGDTTLLTGVALAHGLAGGWSWPLVAAVAVSLTRLTAAGTAARRCARLRSAS
jgi:hypothetical protein